MRELLVLSIILTIVVVAIYVSFSYKSFPT